MDKYEFNIKVEQIKKLVGKNDYDTAMKIADTIDWKRVRNTNLLSMVAMVYEKNEDYQEARDILLQAFERAPIGKRLLYKLAELALKVGDIEEAEAYYKEFGDLASDDPRQQLLRYMILKAKGAPAQQLIHSLESYTSVELDEKWLYELAELYSLAGMPDRCVETCDRIMLMFGLGKYVDQAMNLKIKYEPLTNYQLDLVENRDKYEARLRAVEQEFSSGRRVKPVPEEEYYEEEQKPVISFSENPLGENLEARLQEAATEETLAREMSKMSYDDPVVQEETKLVRTRVLEDIRRVGRPVISISRQRDINTPLEEESLLHHSEPFIEEEELESSVPGIDRYYEGEAEYEEPENLRDQSEISYDILGESADQPADDYVRKEYDSGQPSGSYNGAREEEQSAGTLNPALEEEDFPAWNQEFQNYDEEDNLELQDLYEEEEDEPEETPLLNHLMINARTSEKGLQTAIEALKQIHKENNVKNPVVKTTGAKLSRRGVRASVGKLSGKDLIIEEAGELTSVALEELNELMDQDTSGMIVVLIDNPKQMENLQGILPALTKKFNSIGSGEEAFGMRETVGGDRPDRVVPESKRGGLKEEPNKDHENQEFNNGYDSVQEDSYRADGVNETGVYKGDSYENGDFYEDEEVVRPSVRNEEGPGFGGEEMDLDEFAQYACRYANEIDCSITGKSMLALYERIEIMEEDGLPLNRANAESLIEEVADRAEKPPFGKRIKGLFSTKYDKDGLLVLKEEHFIY